MTEEQDRRRRIPVRLARVEGTDPRDPRDDRGGQSEREDVAVSSPPPAARARPGLLRRAGPAACSTRSRARPTSRTCARRPTRWPGCSRRWAEPHGWPEATPWRGIGVSRPASAGPATSPARLAVVGAGLVAVEGIGQAGLQPPVRREPPAGGGVQRGVAAHPQVLATSSQRAPLGDAADAQGQRIAERPIEVEPRALRPGAAAARAPARCRRCDCARKALAARRSHHAPRRRPPVSSIPRIRALLDVVGGEDRGVVGDQVVDPRLVAGLQLPFDVAALVAQRDFGAARASGRSAGLP